MNNFQLESILKSNVKTKSKFRGVFPSDLPPRYRLKPRESFIYNLCTSETQGCHWSVLHHAGNRLEVFDPVGIASNLFSPPLNEYIKKHMKRVFFNSTALQGEKSIECGRFCIMIVYFKSIGLTNDKIFKFFDLKNLKANDIRVRKMTEKIFRVKKIK